MARRGGGADAGDTSFSSHDRYRAICTSANVIDQAAVIVSNTDSPSAIAVDTACLFLLGRPAHALTDGKCFYVLRPLMRCCWMQQSTLEHGLAVQLRWCTARGTKIAVLERSRRRQEIHINRSRTENEDPVIDDSYLQQSWIISVHLYATRMRFNVRQRIRADSPYLLCLTVGATAPLKPHRASLSPSCALQAYNKSIGMGSHHSQKRGESQVAHKAHIIASVA